MPRDAAATRRTGAWALGGLRRAQRWRAPIRTLVDPVGSRRCRVRRIGAWAFDKRAHIAGEIEQAERRVDPLRTALAHLDAVLRLSDATSNFELIPAIRPTIRGTFFRHGEQMRLCLEALREAKGPMRTRSVTEYAMTAKGLPTDEAQGAGRDRGSGPDRVGAVTAARGGTEGADGAEGLMGLGG